METNYVAIKNKNSSHTQTPQTVSCSSSAEGSGIWRWIFLSACLKKKGVRGVMCVSCWAMAACSNILRRWMGVGNNIISISTPMVCVCIAWNRNNKMAIKTIKFIATSSKSTLNEIRQPRCLQPIKLITGDVPRSLEMVTFIIYIKIKKSQLVPDALRKRH